MLGIKPKISLSQSAVAALAVIGLPLYLGILQISLPQLLLYSIGAGAVLAASDFLEAPMSDRGGFPGFVQKAALWSFAILLVGGTVYFAMRTG